MPQYLDLPQARLEFVNRDAFIPYELPAEDIIRRLNRVYHVLNTINVALVQQGYSRLEDFLLANSFAGILSELIVKSIALSSEVVIANEYVGGIPDLLPRTLKLKAVLKAEEGIEIKASKQPSGWQGHNAEQGWYMVCRYIVDTVTLPIEERHPTTIVEVMLAYLEMEDWSFSGRNEGSRRTPTASIKASGTYKLRSNIVYVLPGFEIAPRTPPKKKSQDQPPLS